MKIIKIKPVTLLQDTDNCLNMLMELNSIVADMTIEGLTRYMVWTKSNREYKYFNIDISDRIIVRQRKVLTKYNDEEIDYNKTIIEAIWTEQ